jgi:signal transduction histidine kinase
MRNRAEQLGGCCDLQADGSGTLVSVRLPVGVRA